MNFNTHFNLAGKHAFLSASKYHWVNYDEDKLATTFANALAAQKGTELHDLAAGLIKNGIRQARTKKTFNMYVNDAIGYRLAPEQVLHYSDNCFGTADAIGFRKNLLQIADLKTGVSPASMTQLEIYAALFCLEYNFKPSEIDIVCRIYQNDELLEHEPELDAIVHIMDRIITFDRKIDQMKMEALA